MGRDTHTHAHAHARERLYNYLYNQIVQLEVCRSFSGRGMGMDIAAHISITFFAGNLLLANCSVAALADEAAASGGLARCKSFD